MFYAKRYWNCIETPWTNTPFCRCLYRYWSYSQTCYIWGVDIATIQTPIDQRNFYSTGKRYFYFQLLHSGNGFCGYCLPQEKEYTKRNNKLFASQNRTTSASENRTKYSANNRSLCIGVIALCFSYTHIYRHHRIVQRISSCNQQI